MLLWKFVLHFYILNDAQILLIQLNLAHPIGNSCFDSQDLFWDRNGHLWFYCWSCLMVSTVYFIEFWSDILRRTVAKTYQYLPFIEQKPDLLINRRANIPMEWLFKNNEEKHVLRQTSDSDTTSHYYFSSRWRGIEFDKIDWVL